MDEREHRRRHRSVAAEIQLQQSDANHDRDERTCRERDVVQAGRASTLREFLSPIAGSYSKSELSRRQTSNFVTTALAPRRSRQALYPLRMNEAATL